VFAWLGSSRDPVLMFPVTITAATVTDARGSVSISSPHEPVVSGRYAFFYFYVLAASGDLVLILGEG
jgi:hypothetical protein